MMPLDHLVSAEWNPINRVPVKDWLEHNMDAESKLRMQTMGNMVVPMQASLGIAALSAVLKLAQEQAA